MIRITLIFIALSLFSYTSVIAQEPVSIYGYVTDNKSGEPIVNAYIYNKTNLKGAISNSFGYYSLTLESVKVNELSFSCIGYTVESKVLKVYGDSLVNVSLVSGIALDEVEIHSRDNQFVHNEGIGRLTFSEELISNTASVGGETNLVETLKRLPGVSSGKEGKSEINVRGGSHDQNQILLDNAPVYNLNHAFGLLSVFNSSTIKSVSLFKGGTPSKYGGFLSSVVDVSIKEGNRQAYKTQLNISTLAAAITTEGPIVKNKSSFMFSARRSWPDLLIRAIAEDSNSESVTAYSFTDINAKLNYTINEKHHLYLSFYTGGDAMFTKQIRDDEVGEKRQEWGNTLSALRYQSISSNGSFNNGVLYYSSYKEKNTLEYERDNSTKSTEDGSSFKEFGGKMSKSFIFGKHLETSFGSSGSFRQFTFPHTFSSVVNSEANSDIYDETQFQVDAYVDNTITTGKLNLNIGLRSILLNDRQRNIHTFEPRFSALFKQNNALSFKMGFMHNNQFLFAMPKQSMGASGYVWLPFNSELDRVSSPQGSLGFTYDLGKIIFDVEAYYKSMSNILGTHLISSKLLNSNDWVNLIQQGDANAKGLDFLVNYRFRNVSSSLKYSLSQSLCSFDNVQNGKWLPYSYDIRHDVALQTTWVTYQDEEKKRWLSSSFVFNSGIPMTIPTQTIPIMPSPIQGVSPFYDAKAIDYFSHPNNMRNKAYHRLDLGFHMQKRLERGEQTWNVGVINVYNNKNTYWIYKEDNEFKSVVLFPMMPFVSYKRCF